MDASQGPAEEADLTARYTDPNSAQWQYQTDAYGYVTSETKPATTDPTTSQQVLAEATWTWTRDRNGLPTEYVQPAGGGGYQGGLDQITTEYSYDGDGNMVSAVYAEGTDSQTSESWTYDPNYSQMTSHTDGDANKTTWDLNSRGEVTAENDPGTFYGTPGKCVTAYTYTIAPAGVNGLPGGLVATSTAAAGTRYAVTATTSYYSDNPRDTGLVQSVTNAYGTALAATVTSRYDSNGALSQTTDEYGRVTKYVNDNLGRAVEEIDSDPATGMADPSDSKCPKTFRLYDALGNEVSDTDPDGNTTTSRYDALDRLVATTLPPPDRAAASRAGGLGSAVPSALVTDETTNEVTVYGYDAVGNEVFVTDPQGRTTHYDYDQRNECVETVEPAPNATLTLAVSAASCGGETMSAVEGIAPVTMNSYDELGDLKATTTDANDPQAAATTDYDYNVLQEKTEMLAPSPNDAGGQTTTTYKYDTDGNLVQTDAPGADGSTAVTNVTYDAQGQELSETDPAGRAAAPRRPISTTTSAGSCRAPRPTAARPRPSTMPAGGSSSPPPPAARETTSPTATSTLPTAARRLPPSPAAGRAASPPTLTTTWAGSSRKTPHPTTTPARATK